MAWTFVTAWFNLEKECDQYQRAHSASLQEYRDNFLCVLRCDINIVVFSNDDDMREVVETATDLRAHVHFVRTEFDDLPMRPHLASVRERRRCDERYADSRNTPEWAVVTTSKVGLMHRAATLNIFNSKVFAWFDSNGYRPGHPYCDYSVEELGRALHALERSSIHRARTVHLGLINWPMTHVRDSATDAGWCSTCGGFYFGDAEAIAEFAALMSTEMREHVEAGREPHADEPLMAKVLVKAPHLFSVFPTDYFCAPFDAIFPHKHAWISLDLLVPGLQSDGQAGLLRDIATRLLLSHVAGRLALSAPQLAVLTSCVGSSE